jgi:hypothetical protein
MPTAARPSTWIDWSSVFKDVIPREWWAGLFASESEAYYDQVAFGEALALARDMLSFLQNSIWPTQDTNHIFTERWERVYGVNPKGSLDDRANRLIALFRQRGTMTEDLVKAIMCRAWDSDDPSIVAISSPAMTPAPQCAKHGAFQGANMHIYHATGAAAPNQGIIEDLISKIKPTWEYWTWGQYGPSSVTNAYYGDGTDPKEGKYNRCCYG